jgi:hypothetical protein
MMKNKICSRCKIEKQISDFAKRKISVDGHEGVCRECRTKGKNNWYSKNKDRYRKSNKKWADKNKEHLRIKTKKYAEKNKDKIKEYRIKNRERILQKAREWQINNPAKCVRNVSARRAAKIKCTPKWLNESQKNQIFEFYQFAKVQTERTGIKHEVDHIIPIKGHNVSGLHVPWNLQVISAEQNRRKSNKLEQG